MSDQLNDYPNDYPTCGVCTIAAQRAKAWRDIADATERLHNLAQNSILSKESSKEATAAYSDALFCLTYLKETENVA